MLLSEYDYDTYINMADAMAGKAPERFPTADGSRIRAEPAARLTAAEPDI